MKQLILVRHAKSSWKEPQLDDHDRTLNKRGKRDAPFMAGILKKRKVKPDKMLSSSAVRAFTTASIFAKELGFDKHRIEKQKELYLAELEDWLQCIKSLEDDAATVIIFGHNPGITWLANYLSDVVVDNVPTCGVCGIGFSFDHWSEVEAGNGKQLFFEYPKLYFKDSAKEEP